MSQAEPDFELAVKDACKDGTVCLNVQVQPSNADSSCIFDHLEPKSGTPVKRDSTVVMVCTPDTTGSTENSQPEPTDTTAPPESSQPPSSDTTEPPENGQSPPSSS